MYIMWDGPGFPTDLIVSFATTAGEPLPDVTLSYVDFFDDMAIYEFGGDPDLTEQLYEFFRANVGNTVPCEISDAMPQHVTVNTNQTTINSNTTINGNLTVTGNTTVQQRLDVIDNATIKGISFADHVHGNVESGNSNTGTPK